MTEPKSTRKKAKTVKAPEELKGSDGVATADTTVKQGLIKPGSIRVTSAIEGFKCAGVVHSMRPQIHAPGAFSEEQIEEMKFEPRLAVEVL